VTLPELGTYAGSSDTEMLVLSTTSWSIASTILWAQSTLAQRREPGDDRERSCLDVSTETSGRGAFTT